jgi:uncharacterized protein YfaS (alpha-2-macroglobulin family)
MSVRAWGVRMAFTILLAFAASAASAQGPNGITTFPDSDYFGFDLRTERDVDLEQCQAVCLADGDCRAFTYNTRARWCFLKSDFSVLNPFPGAIAGKVVPLSGEPDLGAPAELDYVPAEMLREARRYRDNVIAAEPQENVGFGFLAVSAGDASAAGNQREAIASWLAALAISPDEPRIWSDLARAQLGLEGENYEETVALLRDGTSSALNAYAVSRGATERARALAAIGLALDRRDLYRPAIQAYDASLALVPDAAVRAERADLRARKGFRIVNNSVDTELAAPRACVQFSEDLVRSGVDYASFVTVDDRPAQALDVAARQICVEGLEHGRSYRISFRSGLPSSVGEVLEAPVPLDIYVRDRSPSVRFTGPNFVLPASGRHGIPLVSVNTANVELGLFRIGDRSLAQLMSGYRFLRQLDGYEASATESDMGQAIWQGTLEVASELNRDVTTSFPVSEALPNREPGVYVLTAQPEGDQSDPWNSRATQWFVVSDLGIATFAGEDGLSVFVRSLASALPLEGVEVELLARNNEVLGTATTDVEGRAVFTAGLVRGADGMAPAVLTASLNDDDFVFLDMTSGGFDLSDRGVTGRAAPGAMDVFAWTERGIYRAGETVHASALARDDTGTAVANLPLTFIFLRPDGAEDRRVTSDGRALGGHHVAFDTQPTAMRGAWSVRIHADPEAPALAEQRFLVEDFVPDRIEFDLAADAAEIAPGEPASLSVDGRYLYGAPAAGLALEGDISLSTTREWSRFPGYSFGLADEEMDGYGYVELGSLPPTDDEGKASFDAELGVLPSTTRLVSARVSVRMREGGGRAVERRVDLTVRPETPLIGIRPEFTGEQVPEGSEAGFRVMAASPGGERIDLARARWSLVKVERNYQWYRSGTSWNYEPIVVESKVSEGTFDIEASGETRLSLPVAWGRYRLDVDSPDPLGPVASFAFDAGWYVEAASTETPEGLEIALDRESYAPGDTARLQVSPREAGELLVVIGSERLFTTISASVPAGGATIDLPVSGEWGTGTYVTAVLYRPGEASESRLPARAIGVSWLGIDPSERRIEVSLATPERSAPREALTIPVTLAGLEPGEEAYVAVSAVDVGILNLTGYTPPDPEGWYFGQRQLGLELRDLYGRMIDGSAGAAGRIRTGGDGGIAMQGSPPTERLVAFHSGPVRVGDNGRAEIAFDIPEFNGTARVMAVAWSADRVGQADADVVIRDPLVVAAGQPRFLAVGDRSTIRLDIANTDGPAGDYALSLDTSGTAGLDLAGAPETVSLEQGGRQTVSVPVDASATGDATITVALAHEDGTRVERTLFLSVRPDTMPVTNQRVVSLPAAGGSLRIDSELLADSILDGAYVSVGISASSAFDVASLLLALDRYPYGCAEQTISRALPLLYVGELSRIAGLDDDPSLRRKVSEAIERIMTFQSSTGSFGLWGPGFGDLWLDAYVTDFLTRAAEQGYPVPERGLEQALANLQNALSYTTDIAASGTEVAYALYVVARNKRASVGDLRYYADTRLEEFASPMARAQIAASLALYGDAVRAERVFGSALAQARARSEENFYRTDYGSSLRDGAAMLALAAETRPMPASVIPAMIDFVSDERRQSTYTSTQEQAWMVLAARAIEQSGDTIALEVDGVETSGSFSRRMSGEELQGSPMTVVNRGEAAVDAVITTVAAPTDPLPAGGDGFAIERTYYTLAGEQANVTEVTQNERYVVVLRIRQDQDWPARIAVTDLLPAGFEIDNPNMVGSADLAAFEWLGQPSAVHSEFRTDRFVAAFDREQGSSEDLLVAYVVRAVTPGVYSHPGAVVEDMYRPQFSARSASGVMEVMAP